MDSDYTPARLIKLRESAAAGRKSLKKMRHVECRFCVERFTMIAAWLRQKRPLKVTQIAVELEVSEKTIRRDLHFMRDRLGLPVDYFPAAHEWRMDAEAKLPWFWL